ncbi:hypothetical protein M406DRAFT_358658 [Cryphonectria parasitica EP155]|uniref:Uncharacterized protein n=1 Tax=Cryphonectria parasitica (strain ATCC 38755 / EP155) TaxID=660469 RepID=A0A9P4XRZ8_CRYP1|nr:uncharacterized protein M406DRAFT_358658 [Cryphonectria parasitica EP155]KAF3759958.1 hypothetical protein M406DRAFT_358658 [Cryphonectria parasitica EP155]
MKLMELFLSSQDLQPGPVTIAEVKGGLTDGKPTDGKPDTEDSPSQWRMALSPVAEEPRSPVKCFRRAPRPEGYLTRRRPNPAMPSTGSPTKYSSKPVDPGSQMLQNFLDRLDQQGLSHD